MNDYSWKSGIALLLIAIFLIVAAPQFRSTLQPKGTDTAILPADLILTPTRFYVGSIPEGVEAWVSYGAIFVDGDRRVWIAADWVATIDRSTFGDDLHIKREGDSIVLFRDSIGDRRWTPGIDSGWHVDQKKNLLPVVIR